MSLEAPISDAEWERIGSFCAETFEALIGDPFFTQGDSQELLLTEVKRHPVPSVQSSSDAAEPRKPFSILFTGNHTVPLPTGVCRLQHRDLGTFVIGLNPVQIAAGSNTADETPQLFYESVFA